MIERTLLGVLALALVVLSGCGSSDSQSGLPPGWCLPDSTEKADVSPPLTGLGGAMEAVTSFGENPASLAMYVHAPNTPPKAIVLALHGCTQSANDYVNAGWNELADREGLVIVYGEQSAANNGMRCFRWWDAAQIGKSGEAKSLANMVLYAQQKYGVKRAFVTGLSAGGAMTSVMLASYPEIFEAGAIMAGLPYKCATSQTDSFTCMSGSKAHSADEWGALVPSVSASNAPRVSIWQGDADYTVRPANREALVLQWSRVNGVSEEPSESKDEEAGSKHEVHRDANGVARVESWQIPKMGHGVALDPKSGCGKAGAYALDTGLCSTARAYEFFMGTSPRASSASSSSSSSSSASSSGAGASKAPCD